MSEQSPFLFDQPRAERFSIEIPDAELSLYAHAFLNEQADYYLQALTIDTAWRHDEIRIHGKTIALPRLQAWYASEGAVLEYSGMRIPPRPWTSDLKAIRNSVTALTGHEFNAVLVNYYRDGNDSVGWHSDNETQWGPNPVIASVSFGATREFLLKHLTRRDLETVTCKLTHGSVLLMGDTVQNFWQHQLPKRKRVQQPRINLTFRNIV